MAEKLSTLETKDENSVATQTELMQKNIGTELVEKAVQGDESAFEKLYKLTYRYVYAVAKYYLSDDEDIRDAIQDTFARVYKHIGKLNDPEAFAWWLRTIAENCSKTIFSKKEKDSAELSDLEEKIISQEDPLKDNDVALDITEVLLALDPEDAELLTHIYYDKMTVAEIARMKELPDSTVRSRVKSAEKKLREMLRVRGIEKPVYGGEFVAMVTTAFRNAIGTDLLSATVAQEILDNIRGGDEKRGAVIGAVATKERNRAVLRLAGIMVAVAIFFALLFFGGYAIINAVSDKADGQHTAENGSPDTNFWDKLFGNDNTSSDSPSSSDTVNSSDTSHTSSDTTGDDESSDDSSSETPTSSGTSSSKNSSTSIPDFSGISSEDGTSNTSSVFAPTVSNPDYSQGFIPDCEESEFNVIGVQPWNVSSNINKQGDWIYYATESGVYKVRTDASCHTKLSDDTARNINVAGNCIYYAYSDKIIRMLTDGSDKTVVYESAEGLWVFALQVRGDKVYFAESVGDRNYSFMCLDIATGEVSRLVSQLDSDYIVMTDTALVYLKYKSTSQMDYICVYDFATKKEITLDSTNSNNAFYVTEKHVITQDSYGEIRMYELADYSHIQKEDSIYSTISLYIPIDGGITLLSSENIGYGNSKIMETGEIIQNPVAWNNDTYNNLRQRYATFDDGYIYYIDSKGKLQRCMMGKKNYTVYD